MDSHLQSALFKLGMPLVGIAVLLFVTRRRGIPWAEERGLGLHAPRASQAALWLTLWIAWMALCELLIARLGIEQPARWADYPPLTFAVRVAAIGLAGPALEELIMRGLGISLLRRTRLGVRGAVLLTAAVWAAMHVQYEPALIGLIFLDGLFLGACRVVTGSLLLPIAMHALGNLYSIWQSTHG